MQFYLRLAWRNLWRHRRRTVIVVIAMSMGLSLMMLYDGMVAGFNQAIYGNAIKVLGGNIQVHANGYQEQSGENPLITLQDDSAVIKAAMENPQVVSASRRIKTGGLVSGREGALAVEIIGIEPEPEQKVNLAANHMIAGRFLQAADLDGILIGKGLAEAMSINVGDRIAMTGRALHKQMRQRTMTVIGIYDLGMPDIEKRSIYISLGEAQSLYGLENQSTEIAITLQEIGQEAAVMSAMGSKLSGYEIASFETLFPELQQALGTKGAVMDVFSVIILVIAGIGIMNLLLMAIYERTREIGLLGALGLRPWQISALFITEGTMMGLIGVVVGIFVGVLINGLLRQVGLDFSQYSTLTSYMALISGRIYPGWGFDKLWSRALTVAIISALASFYPAREAAMREPAEALHYV
jgi:ABC-type lipoprotein release transport system permease subunit